MGQQVFDFKTMEQHSLSYIFKRVHGIIFDTMDPQEIGMKICLCRKRKWHVTMTSFMQTKPKNLCESWDFVEYTTYPYGILELFLAELMHNQS